MEPIINQGKSLYNLHDFGLDKDFLGHKKQKKQKSLK